MYFKSKLLEIGRPVYIESRVCVVKGVVKCSFKYLCVVHHDTRRQHYVGVGEGTIKKKIAEEYFRSATPGQPPPPHPHTHKKKQSPTLRKKLGIGSPVFLHFWHFLHHFVQAC